MSLDYQLGKIKNYEQVCFQTRERYPDEGPGEPIEEMNGKTQALVFLTITVGIRTITDANAAEFFARVQHMEKLGGTFFSRDGKGQNFTPDDIREHIGLSTNASTKSRAKFLSEQGRLLDTSVREFVRSAKQATPA